MFTSDDDKQLITRLNNGIDLCLTRQKPYFMPFMSERNRKMENNEQAFINIINATENNLKNITVTFPLGVFNCVTGVSGSGKSTLVNEVL